MQGGVFGGGGGEEIVASDVHHDEGVAGNKAAAVCSWPERMPFDVDGRLSDEIGLIFFLDRTGVACGIHQGDEKQRVFRELHSAGVSGLDGRTLTSEKDRGGQELCCFCGRECFGHGRGG